MTQQELQIKYDHLIEKVRRMRGHQREYFKYRARSDLDIARRLEREIDRIIAEEIAQQKSMQRKIF
jgi:hypothetical protein